MFKKANDEFLVLLWEMQNDAWMNFFAFILYHAKEHLNILELQSESKSTHKLEHKNLIHSFFWGTNKYKEIEKRNFLNWK